MSFFKYSLIIGTGGFVGSIARFYLARAVQQMVHTSFPWGTMVVNVLGCFFIGLVYAIAEKEMWLTTEWRVFLSIGLLGGFTTFSALANESVNLMRDGQWVQFFAYPLSSLFLGILAVLAGYQVIKFFL